MFVDLFIVSIVIYFFVIGVYITPLVNSEFSYLMKISILMILITTWLFILLNNYDVIVEGLNIFLNKTLEGLSFFYKVFYTIIAIVLTYVLIIPLVSPLLIIAMALYLPYIIARKLAIRNHHALSVIVFFGLATVLVYLLIIMVIPLYVYAKLTVLLFINLFDFIIYLIYSIAMCIGISASLCDFILLIYEGAHAYDASVEVPLKKILITQILISLILIGGFLYYKIEIASLGLLMSLSILSWYIRRSKGLIRDNLDISMFSALLFVIFGGVSFLRFLEKYYSIAGITIIKLLEKVVLILATLVYFLLLIFSMYLAKRGG